MTWFVSVVGNIPYDTTEEQLKEVFSQVRHFGLVVLGQFLFQHFVDVSYGTR